MADDRDNMPLDDKYIISQIASQPGMTDMLSETLDPSIFDPVRRLSLRTANPSIASYSVGTTPSRFTAYTNPPTYPKEFAPGTFLNNNNSSTMSTSPSSVFDFGGFSLTNDPPPFSTLLNNLANSAAGRDRPRGLDRFTDESLVGLARRLSQPGATWLPPRVAAKPVPQVTPQDGNRRFKPYHEEKWFAKFNELQQYRKLHGNCNVPYGYERKELARWVKRQRRQYKLMQDGQTSAMTVERVRMLDEAGFVWDSHEAVWEERLVELILYKKKNGDTLVPSNWAENKQLSTWVKCQRRLYKLYWAGKSSAMTPERFSKLERIGFEWQIRNSKSSNLPRSITTRRKKGGRRRTSGSSSPPMNDSVQDDDEDSDMLFEPISFL